MEIQYCRIVKSKIDMSSAGHSEIHIKLVIEGKNGLITKKYDFTSALKKDIEQLKTLMNFANVSSVKRLKNCVVKIVLGDYEKMLGFGNPIADEYFLLDYSQFGIYNEEKLRSKIK